MPANLVHLETGSFSQQKGAILEFEKRKGRFVICNSIYLNRQDMTSQRYPNTKPTYVKALVLIVKHSFYDNPSKTISKQQWLISKPSLSFIYFRNGRSAVKRVVVYGNNRIYASVASPTLPHNSYIPHSH